MRSTTARLLRSVLAGLLLLTTLPSAAFAGAPAGLSPSSIAAPRTPSTVQSTGRILVKFKDASSRAVLRTLASQAIADEDVGGPTRRGITSVRVPAGMTAEAYAQQISADPNVEHAVPDYIRYPLGYTSPNDFDYVATATLGVPDAEMFVPYGRSWWLRGSVDASNPILYGGGLNAEAVWKHGYSDPAARNFPLRAKPESFTVAVIDSGFYMGHPDKGDIVAGKDEFERRDPDGTLVTDSDVTPHPIDDASGFPAGYAQHGTAVAGEIAAAANNLLGSVGVGYDAEVRVYKVMGEDFDPVSPAWGQIYIDEQALINAIYDATDDGSRVINMSLGGPVGDPLLQEAIDYAWSKGVVIVAAAGNDRAGSLLYPASGDHVLGVGSYSVNNHGRYRSAFSNYGSGLDLLAPGQSVWAMTDIGYSYWDGTSMASPAAAGAIAHLWRYQPAFTNAEIVGYIEGHMPPVGSDRPNVLVGYGFLDMSTVMDGFMSEYPYLAAPTITSAATTTVGVRTVTWTAVPGRAVSYHVELDGSDVATVTGTSASVGFNAGTHTVTVQAMSAYNWWDGTSKASATVDVATSLAGPPQRWASFSPAGWATTGTPTVSIRARDDTSGLVPSSARYRYSTDDGATWSAWTAASFSAPGLSTATETISAQVPFNNEFETGDKVQFSIANGIGLTGTSATYDVKIDSTSPRGTFLVAGGLTVVSTQRITVNSSVTDTHAVEMRMSGDAGGSWTAWEPYSPTKVIDLSVGRGTKTVRAEYRDVAGNVLALSGTIDLQSPPTVVRTEGSNRYETAIRISQERFPQADTVIIASGAGFADALSAAPLAGSYSAPLLLTTGYELYRSLPAEITRLGATKAIVVGGEPAVSAAVFEQLQDLGLTVRRVSGIDRYATAGAVAVEVKTHEESLGRTFANKAFLARGDSFADALAASPLAYSQRIPILLTRKAEIPGPTWEAIWETMPSAMTGHILVAGGTGAIDSIVAAELTLNGRALTRIGGSTRYETAIALADYGVSHDWAAWSFVGVATGENFPDALGGGVGTGAANGVLLLTPQASAAAACTRALASHKATIDIVDVFGGSSAVSNAAYNTLRDVF